VQGAVDLKNALQIITLPDDLYSHWESFLTKQAEGELIDPVTCQPFSAAKDYKKKKSVLKREFFKKSGHFTDKDFRTFAQHLLAPLLDARGSI